MPRLTGSIGGVNSSRPDRATIETESAVAKRMMYTKFIQLITASSVQVDYFSINYDETTYSENINQIKNQLTAKHFDLIEGFVIYDRGGQDLGDKTEPGERTISISLESKQSIILMNTIYPKEGDHFIMKSQGKIAKPYMVTKVQPEKFMDNEVWVISYSESSQFNLQQLMDRVVNTYEYVAGNIGSARGSILEKGSNSLITEVEAWADSINKMYVELFYDNLYSVLRFKPLNNPNFFYEYYCNSKMQDDGGEQILKYGMSRSTLMLINTYDFDNTESDYMDSLYRSLRERYFEERACYQEYGDENKITSVYTEIFNEALKLRELIFGDYRGVPSYTSKYVFGTRLYFRGKSNHRILTRFYNSSITLIDMFNKPSYFDPLLRSQWVWYEIASPYILPILDMYMDSDYKGILNHVKTKMRRFRPDKNNIDDFFGVPLMLLAIKDAVDNVARSADSKTYR